MGRDGHRAKDSVEKASWTDLSAVHTANFMLLEDQLRAVILAAPSWQAKCFSDTSAAFFNAVKKRHV